MLLQPQPGELILPDTPLHIKIPSCFSSEGVMAGNDMPALLLERLNTPYLAITVAAQLGNFTLIPVLVVKYLVV
jgi:hypothetical protein